MIGKGLQNRPFLKRRTPNLADLVHDRADRVRRKGCGLSKTSNRLLKGSGEGLAETVILATVPTNRRATTLMNRLVQA